MPRRNTAQVRAEAERVPTPQEKAEQLKTQQAQAAAARAEAAERKAQLEKERRAKLTPAQRNGENLLTGAFVVALFIFGGWILKGCFTTSSSPTQVSDGLIREYCLSAVRDKLKAPSSAEFNDPTLPVQNSAGAWTWTSYVEADNSFGAKIKTDFYCAGKGSDADHVIAEAVLF